MTILEVLQQNHELFAAYAAILVAIFSIIFTHVSSKKIRRQQNEFQVTRDRIEVIERARNEMKEKVTRSDFLRRLLVHEDSKGTLDEDTSISRSNELLGICSFAIGKLEEIEHHLSGERKDSIKGHQKDVEAKASRAVNTNFKSKEFLGPTLEFPRQLFEVLDQELIDLKKRLSE